MDNTIIQQGSFTSAGLAKTIELRSDVDWFRVYNMTTTAAAGADTGVEFFWMRGMADGTGIEYAKTAVTGAMTPSVLTSGGFTLVDTSVADISSLNTTVTAISNAAIPVVSATSTAGLVAGKIVRFGQVTGGLQFSGVDFEVDTIVANTSFRLPYAPQIAAATTGNFYIVSNEDKFYPSTRYISKITAASPAVITTTVSHGLTAGQKFRVIVPSSYGMTQMNNLVATAVSVTASTITTDIDSSAFSAFAWPLTTEGPSFERAIIVPFGETASLTYAMNTDDARRNITYIGMQLDAGTNSPAGANGDVIYWQAGKSFSVTAE